MLIELDNDIHWIIILMGVLLALSLGIKAFFKVSWFAPITGFLGIGIVLRLGNDLWGGLPASTAVALDFLGQLGIIIILFDAGMKCHLSSLFSHIKTTSFIAFVNVLVSGFFGFAVGYYLLAAGLITTLFISAAFVATSIAVAMAMWSSSQKLESKPGRLLVGLAVLDDIAGIILMAFLFELVPLIKQEAHSEILPTFLSLLSFFLLKFVFFMAIGQIFSLFVEWRLVKFLKKWEPAYDRTITILSVGFIIAGIAYYFGFSLGLGAFFAGIAFSRDPESVKLESAFKGFEDFFGPFFFISIGFQVSLIMISPALLWIIAALFLAAVGGKYLGTVVPAVFTGLKLSEANLLGISMIPRAEIAMIIMERGFSLGPWAVSESIYTAMIIVALLTCLLTPLALKLFMPKQLNIAHHPNQKTSTLNRQA